MIRAAVATVSGAYALEIDAIAAAATRSGFNPRRCAENLKLTDCLLDRLRRARASERPRALTVTDSHKWQGCAAVLTRRVQLGRITHT